MVVWASASASNLQSRCGDRHPAPVAASALSPLGLSDFDLWILGYEFLGHERDPHAPTRMSREHPAEFGE